MESDRSSGSTCGDSSGGRIGGNSARAMGRPKSSLGGAIEIGGRRNGSGGGGGGGARRAEAVLQFECEVGVAWGRKEDALRKKDL